MRRNARTTNDRDKTESGASHPLTMRSEISAHLLKNQKWHDLDANTSTSIGIAGDHVAIEKHLRHPLMPFLLLVCYAAFLILTLPDYGVTWDEIGWFNYGYQQWAWILNGGGGPFKDPRDYFHYGSLAPLVAAATHHLFHDILQWVSADVGYHLANVGFALILAAGILVWGKQTLGDKGAALAILAWLLLPRLWPDAHNNISDLPGAAGSFWAAWSAWRISEAAKPRAIDYILCGFLVGIAYSLRAPNVHFLGLAILIWFCSARFLLKATWPSVPWWGPLLALTMFFLTVKLANPHLWNESVFRQVLWTNPRAYLYSGIGKEDLWFMGRYYGLGSVPIYYAPWFWLISTPLLILFCWAVAVGKIIQDGANASSSLLLFLVLWATAVFKHLTGSGNYDGIRHFLEAYAPMSLLAAQGALTLIGHVQRYSIWRKRLAYSLICLGVMIPLYSGWRIHPYQSGYFNIFAGSISRAWKDYEVEYWGYSFLPASNWVKEHIGPNATVYVPDAGHIGKYYLDPPFKVSAIKIYDFSGVSEFVGHLMSMLEKASSGSVLMILNRPRIWQMYYFDKNISFQCPSGWSLIHEEGPDSKLPPMMIICQKKEVTS